MVIRMLKRIVADFALLLLTIIAARHLIMELLVAAYYSQQGDVDHMYAEH